MEITELKNSLKKVYNKKKKIKNKTINYTEEVWKNKYLYIISAIWFLFQEIRDIASMIIIFVVVFIFLNIRYNALVGNEKMRKQKKNKKYLKKSLKKKKDYDRLARVMG